MQPPPDAVAAATHPDPYPFYDGLLRDRPAARDASGTWVFASAAAVEAAFASPACAVRPAGEPVPRPLADSAAGAVYGRLLRMREDAPGSDARRRLRGALAGVLRTLDAADVAAASRDAAGWLDDELAGLPAPERADATMARLPGRAVAALLGVPAAECAAAAAHAGAFVRAAAPASTPDERARGADAAGALLAVLGGVLDAGEARECLTGGPRGPALLARFRAAARAAGCDDDAEVLANAVGLLFQTRDATAGLIGNALVALARDARLADAVCAAPGRLPAFLREVLRADPPVQNTRRYVAADAVVAGRTLRAGDAVLLVLAAANRDPAANPDPGRFSLDRACPRLFTFGVGRHACVGEALAVGVAVVAVPHLVAALGDPAALAASADPPAPWPAYRPSANARVPHFGAHRQEHRRGEG